MTNGNEQTMAMAKNYETCQSADHTLNFRKDMQPFLDGPFDSQEHRPFRSKSERIALNIGHPLQSKECDFSLPPGQSCSARRCCVIHY